MSYHDSLPLRSSTIRYSTFYSSWVCFLQRGSFEVKLEVQWFNSKHKRLVSRSRVIVDGTPRVLWGSCHDGEKWRRNVEFNWTFRSKRYLDTATGPTLVVRLGGPPIPGVSGV